MANDASAVTMADEGLAPEVEVGRTDAMTSIAGQIRYLSTGDRAALRRIYLTGSRAADGVVVKLLHGAKVAWHDDQARFDHWKLISHVAATLSGTGAVFAHSGDRALGRALHAAGGSENRLLRLTATRGGLLRNQVVTMARIVARAGKVPVDLWTVFALTGRDLDRAEEARIRIAKDYYAAAARSEEESTK